MQEQLRVDTAAVQTMASGWSALIGDLNAAAGPAELGLPCQPSAAAVNAAHAAAAVFTKALTAQVRGRTAQVVDAHTSYLANEASSADKLTGVSEV